MPQACKTYGTLDWIAIPSICSFGTFDTHATTGNFDPRPSPLELMSAHVCYFLSLCVLQSPSFDSYWPILLERWLPNSVCQAQTTRSLFLWILTQWLHSFQSIMLFVITFVALILRTRTSVGLACLLFGDVTLAHSTTRLRLFGPHSSPILVLYPVVLIAWRLVPIRARWRPQRPS